jgi:hypothetical protein
MLNILLKFFVFDKQDQFRNKISYGGANELLFRIC